MCCVCIVVVVISICAFCMYNYWCNHHLCFLFMYGCCTMCFFVFLYCYMCIYFSVYIYICKAPRANYRLGAISSLHYYYYYYYLIHMIAFLKFVCNGPLLFNSFLFLLFAIWLYFISWFSQCWSIAISKSLTDFADTASCGRLFSTSITLLL